MGKDWDVSAATRPRMRMRRPCCFGSRGTTGALGQMEGPWQERSRTASCEYLLPSDVTPERGPETELPHL